MNIIKILNSEIYIKYQKEGTRIVKCLGGAWRKFGLRITVLDSQRGKQAPLLGQDNILAGHGQDVYPLADYALIMKKNHVNKVKLKYV